MGTRVTIDPDLCVGSAECVRILPGSFRIDPSRGVSVPTSAAADADPALLREAERSCPMQAIRVERDE